MRTAFAVASVILITAVVGSAPATADQGVSIDLGSVALDEPLVQGTIYRLPEMTVSNPGDESATYLMEVRAVTGQTNIPLDMSWFSFDPERFDLGPDASQVVTISVKVPEGAAPGAYSGLVAVNVAAAPEGVSVGAAAAAKLSFEVAKPDTVFSPIAEWWDTNAAIALWLGAIVAFVLSLRIIGKRFTISIKRR
jgi:hypothetical protein